MQYRQYCSSKSLMLSYKPNKHQQARVLCAAESGTGDTPVTGRVPALLECRPAACLPCSCGGNPTRGGVDGWWRPGLSWRGRTGGGGQTREGGVDGRLDRGGGAAPSCDRADVPHAVLELGPWCWGAANEWD